MQSVGKALVIIAAGLFCIWLGLRSASGYESDAEHLYGGQVETITCEDGNPTSGQGIHTPSAEQACEEEQRGQRQRSPWWLVAGGVITGIGMTRFRKARGK